MKVSATGMPVARANSRSAGAASGADHAVAGQGHRVDGAADQVGGLQQLARARLGRHRPCAAAAARRRSRAAITSSGSSMWVAPGFSRLGDLEGLAHDLGDDRRVRQPRVPLGDRAHHAQQVDVLVRLLVHALEVALAGEGHERRAVEVGVGHRGDEVQRAGAERAEADARAPGQAPVHVRHVGAALLVAHRDELDRGVARATRSGRASPRPGCRTRASRPRPRGTRRRRRRLCARHRELTLTTRQMKRTFALPGLFTDVVSTVTLVRRALLALRGRPRRGSRCPGGHPPDHPGRRIRARHRDEPVRRLRLRASRRRTTADPGPLLHGHQPLQGPDGTGRSGCCSRPAPGRRPSPARPTRPGTTSTRRRPTRCGWRGSRARSWSARRQADRPLRRALGHHELDRRRSARRHGAERREERPLPRRARVSPEHLRRPGGDQRRRASTTT